MYNDFSGEDKVKAKITKREYENLSEKLTFFSSKFIQIAFFLTIRICVGKVFLHRNLFIRGVKMPKPIEELTFTDDFLFGRVMQNAEICN